MNENKPDNDLQNLRSQIDKTDANIVKLLSERLAAAKKIAEYKKARGLEIFQKDREAEVFKNIADKIKQTGNQEYEKYILQIYGAVLEASKTLQRDILE